MTQQDQTISVLFKQMRDELDLIFGREATTDIENVFQKARSISPTFACARTAARRHSIWHRRDLWMLAPFF